MQQRWVNILRRTKKDWKRVNEVRRRDSGVIRKRLLTLEDEIEDMWREYSGQIINRDKKRMNGESKSSGNEWMNDRENWVDGSRERSNWCLKEKERWKSMRMEWYHSCIVEMAYMNSLTWNSTTGLFSTSHN